MLFFLGGLSVSRVGPSANMGLFSGSVVRQQGGPSAKAVVQTSTRLWVRSFPFLPPIDTASTNDLGSFVIPARVIVEAIVEKRLTLKNLPLRVGHTDQVPTNVGQKHEAGAH